MPGTLVIPEDGLHCVVHCTHGVSAPDAVATVQVLIDKFGLLQNDLFVRCISLAAPALESAASQVRRPVSWWVHFLTVRLKVDIVC